MLNPQTIHPFPVPYSPPVPYSVPVPFTLFLRVFSVFSVSFQWFLPLWSTVDDLDFVALLLREGVVQELGFSGCATTPLKTNATFTLCQLFANLTVPFPRTLPRSVQNRAFLCVFSVFCHGFYLVFTSLVYR